ncbi:MAG: glycosyltransferase family 2 protein [Nocardioides sp.]
MPKVSVIVPTYCSGEGLDRVVASLDAQTMAAADIELVLVDDGSPDDTFARLEKLAAERPNVRIAQIPNSGWPSRPRNVGLDLAKGEFVVFMDHDDELYPDALRAAYDVASSQGADVVSAKEIRTNEWFAYFNSFRRDVAVDEPRQPQHLSPWTTHKLFRRQFLLDSGIRFREGSRMLWEDVMVDIDVYAATDRIAVLASVPFYKWVLRRGENTSLTYGHDLDAYVESIAMMYDHLDDSGVAEEFVTFMKAHQYGLRILSYLAGPRGLRREPEDRARSLDQAHEFVRTTVPAELDELVSPADRARADLLRADRQDLIEALAEHDDGARAIPVATSLHAGPDGRLAVDLRATLTRGPEGDVPFLFRQEGGRLLRILDDRITAALSAPALDVTNALDTMQVDLVVTDKDSSVGWQVPVSHRVEFEPADGGVSVTVRGSATIDVDHAALGAALTDGTWTVTLRVSFMGFASHLPVRYDGPALLRQVGERAVSLAPGGKNGKLRLDVGLANKPVMAWTRPHVRGVEVQRGPGQSVLRLPVTGLAPGSGGVRRPLELRAKPVGKAVPGAPPPSVFPAELVVEDGAAAVECALKLPPGEFRIAVRDLETKGFWVTPLVVSPGRRGALTWRKAPVPKSAKKRWVARKRKKS